jgi:hypothetical protein
MVIIINYIKNKTIIKQLLIIAKTKMIGLRRFLAFARVPKVDLDKCLCKKGKKTAEHVLLYCDNTP